MKRFGYVCALLLVVVALSGCDEVVPARAQISIDEPLDGAEVHTGIVSVRSRAVSGTGVARVELWVNGALYRSDDNPTPDERVIYVVQPWVPTAPGSHVLEVRAYATDDTVSDPARVTVRVTGEVARATETPTPEPTPVPLTDTPSDTPAPPTETHVSEAPPTDTPVSEAPPTDAPEARVEFWADSTSLEAGDCTTIHWETDNVQAVYFDGRGVAGVGVYWACPCAPVSYTLDVTLTSGEHDIRVLDIEVTGSCITPTPGQPDSAGPAISDLAVSEGAILWPAGCAPDQVAVSASVLDASEVFAVNLVYRVVDDASSKEGDWQALTMSETMTGTYTVTVGGEDLQRSLDPPTGGVTTTLEYYIRANDIYDNLSESDTESIDVGYCAQ